MWHILNIKNMKTKGLLLIALLLGWTITGQAADRVKGDGNIITRTIPVEDFDRIVVGDNIEPKGNPFGGKKKYPTFNYMQTLGTASLQITMDENLFSVLDIIQTKGEIKIQTKNNRVKIQPTQLKISGSSRELSYVGISGCMNFISENQLKSDKLEMAVSGVGDITIEDFTCDELSCNVSGVGNIYLSGKVKSARYGVSGVGKVYAFGCQVENLRCDVSGVGGMQVWATESLKANASGVGGIKYKGDPKTELNASGVGSIKQVED